MIAAIVCPEYKLKEEALLETFALRMLPMCLFCFAFLRSWSLAPSSRPRVVELVLSMRADAWGAPTTIGCERNGQDENEKGRKRRSNRCPDVRELPDACWT